MPETGIPTLARLLPSERADFVTPVKRINDGSDLTFWLTSIAYRDLTLWLLQLNRCMFPSIDSTSKYGSAFALDCPIAYSPQVERVRSILTTYDSLLAKAPPHTGPRRFGNAAFRDWYHLAEEATDELVKACLKTGGGDRADNVLVELRAYLLGGLGSPQRLDYGTGHELSFLAFLGGLWKLGLFEDGEERAIVSRLIQPYLELIRKVILTYTLEPAGSHGVWGLDDHSFVPYIFGSAQFGPPIDHADRTRPTPTEGSFKNSPAPSSVTKKDTVADFKDSNMYFSAIQFIYDVKRGPFWEHSPVLYDISGIKDGWGKINKGMLKMYAAEVLGKFPVVQHFPFGHLFRWEVDPEARKVATSVHTQAQPGPRIDAALATAMSTGTLPARPSSTLPGGGTSSTRAPWASTGVATVRPGMAPPPSQHTVAPWQARRGQ